MIIFDGIDTDLLVESGSQAFKTFRLRRGQRALRSAIHHIELLMQHVYLLSDNESAPAPIVTYKTDAPKNVTILLPNSAKIELSEAQAMALGWLCSSILSPNISGVDDTPWSYPIGIRNRHPFMLVDTLLSDLFAMITVGTKMADKHSGIPRNYETWCKIKEGILSLGYTGLINHIPTIEAAMLEVVEGDELKDTLINEGEE